MENKKFYTVTDLSERYSVKPATVWGWIRNGKLTAIKIGKQYRIPETIVTQFERNAERGD